MGIEGAILNGEYDSQLSSIVEAIKLRKRSMAPELEDGDTVKFISTVRPKYLAGVEGTVTGKRTKNFTVNIGRKIGRYGPVIVTGPHLVEKV